MLRLLEKDMSARFASAEECASILQEELAKMNNPALAPERRGPGAFAPGTATEN